MAIYVKVCETFFLKTRNVNLIVEVEVTSEDNQTQ